MKDLVHESSTNALVSISTDCGGQIFPIEIEKKYFYGSIVGLTSNNAVNASLVIVKGYI